MPLPIWLLGLIYFFFLSLTLAIWAALGDGAALAAIIVLTILLVYIALRSRFIVAINGQELRVGRAHIDLKFLGEAVSLSDKQVAMLRSRDADPAAFLGIRFWIASGVQVMLNDERDTTPYWLISSRKAADLATALNQAAKN